MKKLLGSIISVSLLLAGCSSGSSQDNDHQLHSVHQQNFEFYLANELTDFERGVLLDFWVSDEEWNDAQSRYGQCIGELGWEPWMLERELGFGVSQKTQDRLFSQHSDDIEVVELITEKTHECANGTVRIVGMMYFEPRNNPEGLDAITATRRCYEKHNLEYDRAMSNTEFEAMINDSDYDRHNPPQRSACTDNPGYGDW